LTSEGEIMHKGQEDRSETTLGINVVPQEPTSTPTEVIMHGNLAQAANKDDEATPYSLFQSMMPRWVRRFRSPLQLMKEIVVPPGP